MLEVYLYLLTSEYLISKCAYRLNLIKLFLASLPLPWLTPVVQTARQFENID